MFKVNPRWQRFPFQFTKNLFRRLLPARLPLLALARAVVRLHC
jgi:hypothetical protein